MRSPLKTIPADHEPQTAFEATVLLRLDRLEDGQKLTWKLGVSIGGTIIMLLITCLSYMITHANPFRADGARSYAALETVAYGRDRDPREPGDR